MRCYLIPALDAYLAEWAQKPFAYGSADCVLFVGGWVQVATGADPLASMTPWTSEDEAMAVLAACGHATLADAVSSVLTPVEPGPSFARRGDIVQWKGRDPLGLCLGADAVFLFEDRGLVRLPLSVCGRAWRVD